jgi:hypothetical protein
MLNQADIRKNSNKSVLHSITPSTLLTSSMQVLRDSTSASGRQFLKRDPLHTVGSRRRDRPATAEGPVQSHYGCVPVQGPVQEKGCDKLGAET